MKAIFKSLLMLIGGGILFASCVAEADAPLAAAVSTDKTEVVLEAIDGTATFEVKADGEWIASTSSSDTWLTFNPTSGTGNTKVTVVADNNVDSYNEMAGPRSGLISIIGSEAIATVKVAQKGEAGLDATRMYTKVTKAEDLEAGKAYLIVAKKEDKLLAAKPFNASYSWLYTDEVEEKDGVISLPNASNGFTFVSKGDGYAIQMSNGLYFYMTSYDSFNTTDSVDDADVWTVSFNEDGTAKILNTNVNKYFQYSSYGSYGAYAGAQDNAILPSLYKDSAAPSDETLTVDKETSVPSFATTASIAVTSNKTWKVRNHDSWVKTFTKEGTGNGTIEIEFDANTGTEPRTATFKIIGETTSFDITLVQSVPMTIAEAIELEEDAAAELANVTVVGIHNKGFLAKDDTGLLLVYENKKPTVAIGDVVKVFGKMDAYGGLAQVASPTVLPVSEGTYTQPQPEVLNAAAIEALVAAPVAKYVQYSGKLSISGSYYNVAVDGTSKQGSLSYPIAGSVNADLNGCHVIVKGYVIGQSNDRYLNTMLVEIAEDTSIPVLNVNPSSLSFAADGGSKEVTVEVRNTTETYNAVCDNNVFTVAKNGNVVTVTAPANATSEAITGKLTITVAGLTKEVAISQAGKPAEGAEVWSLVTDAATLAVGDKVVIVAAGSNFALSQVQQTKYREQVEITKPADKLTISFEETTKVEILTLAAGSETGSFAFATSSTVGYLNLAKDANELHTGTEVAKSSSWNITINDSVAKVQNANLTERCLEHNSNNTRFACYKASSNQKPISIYKLTK